MTLDFGAILYSSPLLLAAYEINVDLTQFPTLVFAVSIIFLLLGVLGSIATKWFTVTLPSWARWLVTVIGTLLLIFSLVSFWRDSSPPNDTTSTPNVEATIAAVVSATLESQSTPASTPTLTPTSPTPTPNVEATIAAAVSATLESQSTPTSTPTLTPTSIPTPTPTSTPSVTKTPIIHRVMKNENLWCISEKYYGKGSGLFFEELCTHNRLTIGDDCTIIQQGQWLIIPTNEDYQQLPPLRTPVGERGKDYFCVEADAGGS